MRLSFKPGRTQDPAGNTTRTPVSSIVSGIACPERRHSSSSESGTGQGRGVKDGAPLPPKPKLETKPVSSKAGSVQGAGTGAFPGVKAGTRVEAVASVAAGFSAFQYGARYLRPAQA